ncbi:MAG: histidine kinase dimerization/phospho-acceptor domain-containing protein [Chloroflexota bacterium]
MIGQDIQLLSPELLEQPDRDFLKTSATMLTLQQFQGRRKDGEHSHEPDDPRLHAAIQERARTGQYRSEFTLRRVDKTAFEAEVSSMVFEASPGYGRASLIIRDVTDRRASEQAQRQVQAAAEHANAAKGEFVSRMSHELRTHLNAMLGFAKLLGLDVLCDDQRDTVNHVMRAGRHLLQLANEVLDIAGIEWGRILGGGRRTGEHRVAGAGAGTRL